MLLPVDNGRILDTRISNSEVINGLGFAADVLLWEIDVEEAGRSGVCVVYLCGVVPAPSE
jgi:hypothetical protein